MAVKPTQHIWDTFEERMQAKRDQKRRGPFIDIITILLPILLQFLQQCFQPTTAMVSSYLSKYGRPMIALRVYGSSRSNRLGLAVKDCFDVADDVIEVWSEADENERIAFIASVN